MDYRPIFNEERCTVDVPGQYIPIIDWSQGIGTPTDTVDGVAVHRRIVPAGVEHQGEHPVCWGFAPGKLSETAHINAGQPYLPASIQDLLDHGYLPREDKTGHAPTALQYIKQHGVCLEDDYEYIGRPPGITDPIPPHPVGVVRRQIHDWYPVNNVESDMLAALQHDVLLVSVPMFGRFCTLTGRELLDLSAAEVTHNIENRKRKMKQKEELYSHCVLLIGAGYFVPTDYPHLLVNYWVIKNQWGIFFGDMGIGYLIRNSSLADMHSRLRPKTRGFQQLLQPNYFPYFAFVRGRGRADPVFNSIVIREGITVHQLVKWVTGKPFLKDLLVYFFYDPGQCALIPGGFDADELFTALGKTFAHDSSGVRLVLVDVAAHPTVIEKFRLGTQARALHAYLPREFYRTFSHSKRYEGEYNLGELLLWFGDTLCAGVPPS